MAEQKPLLMLLDGHAMVFRAWFSIPERLSTSAGIDTRGVYGFMSTFIKPGGKHDSQLDTRPKGWLTGVPGRKPSAKYPTMTPC